MKLISILDPIKTGISKDKFGQILENKIYTELDMLN